MFGGYSSPCDRGATKFGTLAFKIADLVAESPLFKNDSHSLEASGSLVTLGEVKRLRGSICEAPRGHRDLLRQLLPIRSEELLSARMMGLRCIVPVPPFNTAAFALRLRGGILGWTELREPQSLVSVPPYNHLTA